MDFQFIFNQVMDFFIAQDYAKAKQLFKQISVSDPDDMDCLKFLKLTDQQLGMVTNTS